VFIRYIHSCTVYQVSLILLLYHWLDIPKKIYLFLVSIPVPHFHTFYLFGRGPGSVVGIVTGYRLGGWGIETRWRARFSAPIQTGPGAHPACCTMGTGSFLGVKSGQGVTLTPHPLLVPWSRKGGTIPLLLLRAVRPVQSLSACARVHFTFTFTYLDRRCLVDSNFY
jgi:hypothetical protein